MRLYLYLIGSLTFVLINSAFAQDDKAIAVSKSPNIPYFVGGINRAGVSGVDNKSDISPLTSFNFGVGFLTLINKPGPASLTVEALYSGQGYKINGVTRNSSPEYMRLNYINIPAVLRFNLSKSSNFYLGIGPQIGFVVDGNIVAKDGSKTKFSESSLDKTAFDAVGTFGTYFRGRADMGVEFRFQGGLNKFMNSRPDYRHSVLQLRLIAPMFFL